MSETSADLGPFAVRWHGLVLAGFKPGESVAVFGAGPVGLMAAYSAVIRGASRVFVVDQVKERLDQVRCQEPRRS